MQNYLPQVRNPNGEKATPQELRTIARSLGSTAMGGNIFKDLLGAVAGGYVGNLVGKIDVFKSLANPKSGTGGIDIGAMVGAAVTSSIVGTPKVQVAATGAAGLSSAPASPIPAEGVSLSTISSQLVNELKDKLIAELKLTGVAKQLVETGVATGLGVPPAQAQAEGAAKAAAEAQAAQAAAAAAAATSSRNSKLLLGGAVLGGLWLVFGGRQ